MRLLHSFNTISHHLCFTALLLVFLMAPQAFAQALFDRISERAGATAEQRRQEIIDALERKREAMEQQIEAATKAEDTPGAPETAEAAPESSAASVAAGNGGNELSYENVLPLYIAAHHDLLDTPGFAWTHFELFEAPVDEACSQLKQEARNPIRFSEMVDREARAFPGQLAQLAAGPVAGEFTTTVSLVLDEYDLDREAFPIRSLSLMPRNLEPAPRCDIYESPSSVNYAPVSFLPELVTEAVVTEWPMDRTSAADFIDRNSSRFSIAGLASFQLPATVRVSEVPFNSDNGRVTLPVELREVILVDPSNGSELGSFSSDMFRLQANDETLQETAASTSILPLTQPALALYLIRDNPDLLTPEVAHELARRQIEAEQKYWRTIDGNAAGAVSGALSSSASRFDVEHPIHAYEWQSLQDANPALAAQLYAAVIRPDRVWQYHLDNPDYDPRLDTYTATTVFAREAIGLPALAALDLAAGGGKQDLGNLPAADYLAAELGATMAAYLAAAGDAMPEQVRMDLELSARYDAGLGKLLVGTRYAALETEEPAYPFTEVQRPTFAVDDTRLESASSWPLPTTAEGRVLYQLRAMPEPAILQQDVNRSRNTSQHSLRSLLATGSLGGIQALALDQEVVFQPVALSDDAAMRAQGNPQARTFEITGRVILDIESADAVRLHYDSGQGPRTVNNGALLARVAGLELIDSEGRLIARQ